MAALTRYARNGDVNLAYQVHGEGPLDLLFVSAYINHVEHVWEDPALARFLNRLAGFARLIVMDRRGSGLSDDGELGVEAELGDVDAVLDAAGSERAALLSYTAGGPLAAIFAARHPERVSALVLYACMLRAVRDDDLPWLPDAAERDARFAAIAERWGTGANIDAPRPERGRRRGAAGVVRAPRAARREPRSPAPARRRLRRVRPAPRAGGDRACRRSCCTAPTTGSWTCATRASTRGASRARGSSSCPAPTRCPARATATRCWGRSRSSSPAAGAAPSATARC